MATTYTTNLGLQKPATSDRNWDVPINANADALDGMTAIGGLAVTTTEYPSNTLQVAVSPGNFLKSDGTVVGFEGTPLSLIPASSTVVLWLTDAGVLNSGSSFPTTVHLRLAEVVSSPTSILQIRDERVPYSVMGSGLGFVLKSGDTLTGPLTITSPSGGSPLVVADPVHALLGFFGASPASQAALLTPLTSSSSGIASDTIADLGTTFSPSVLNNNFASLSAKVNALIMAFQRHGLMEADGVCFMPAFASIESTSISLARPATPVGVFRYQPGGVGNFQSLSNIRVLSIQYREGADPGVARFRYVFDQRNPSIVPNSFQTALSVDANLPGVVANDDRLVVLTFDPEGTPEVLFDGFAQVPELGLATDQEMVTFLALGVAIREWDTPIGGALMRNSVDPTLVSDFLTDLVIQFNPQGLPNATPEGADATDDLGNTFATFLDPLIVRDPEVRRLWTLPMAIRYLCFTQNPDQTYVTNPDGSLLDQLLDSRVAATDDPESYQSDPLVVPDYPATGKAWPAVVRDLIEKNGFGMAFRLVSDPYGNPSTILDVFRRQDGSPSTYKDLYLQPRGSTLDPGQSNMAEAQLARDMTGLANAFEVDSELLRYEASFILAPGFAISPDDAAGSTALSEYEKNGTGFSQTNHDQYRLYVFDETGEGHWDWETLAVSNTVPSLDALLGTSDDPTGGYVIRRRVPIGELFSLDPNQKPLKAQLSISTDYQGSQPGLWDGTGTWQPIGGGYQLLKDRLGIWINVPNPNRWNIQASKVSNAPYPTGVVKGVEDQAISGPKNFSLRLTCVIEGDRVLAATADRNPSSPTKFTISRQIDARDRYARHVITAGSEFNIGSGQIVVRDDSLDALAEATARRAAHDSGEVAGVVVIPRFTQAYRIGDRICSIQGRKLSLRTNAGTPTEEAAVFPAVVGLTWNFVGKQETLLQLSDQRGLYR